MTSFYCVRPEFDQVQKDLELFFGFVRGELREGSNRSWEGRPARRSATLNGDSCCNGLSSWKEGLKSDVSTTGSGEWSRRRECGWSWIGIDNDEGRTWRLLKKNDGGGGGCTALLGADVATWSLRAKARGR